MKYQRNKTTGTEPHGPLEQIVEGRRSRDLIEMKHDDRGMSIDL
jgi:hypothetical protein